MDPITDCKTLNPEMFSAKKNTIQIKQTRHVNLCQKNRENSDLKFRKGTGYLLDSASNIKVRN